IQNTTIYISPTKYTANNRQCELFKDLNFVVTSSLLSFYFPLVIMIFLYIKVLYAIRQQSLKMKKKSLIRTSLIKKNTNRTTISDINEKSRDSSSSIRESTSQKSFPRCCFKSSTNQTPSKSKLFRHQSSSKMSQSSFITDDIQHNNDQQQLRRREITAEARVTRSLAVVIGCFICCWLPFFTLYIIRAVCLCLSFNAIEFFVWLGYSNSSINPVLYAILNKNFRLAFKNIFISVKKILFV
ncbi:unnamed protein product, partial [Adineta ricciae]